MSNNRHLTPVISSGLIVALHTASALASPEGAGVAEAVLLIVKIAAIALVTLMIAGGIIGGYVSMRKGESIPKGSAIGVLKGMFAFVALCCTSTIALTFFSFLWVAYGFMVTY